MMVAPSAIPPTAVFKGKVRPILGLHTKIEDYVLLDTGVLPRAFIRTGQRCKIKQGVIIRSLDGFVSVGNRVSIGEYTVIAGHGGVTIGDETIIASHCSISAANHIFTDETTSVRYQGETAAGIEIGSNVWIGSRVVILDGVSIASGVIVGAGSVVTRSLPPNSICVGVPCRVIRLRSKG